MLQTVLMTINHHLLLLRLEPDLVNLKTLSVVSGSEAEGGTYVPFQNPHWPQLTAKVPIQCGAFGEYGP